MREEKEWYSNKELFEKITGMTDTMQNFQLELVKTQNMIKEYNGLREKVDADRVETEKVRKEIDDLKRKMGQLENQKKGKESLRKDIKEWGGWIFAFLTLVAEFLRLKLGG